MKNTIKNTINIAFLTISLFSYGQVVIGKDAQSIKLTDGSVNPSVLLSFGNDNNKGIILPYIETLPSTAAPGTLIFDATADAEYKVKVKLNSGWKDLSVESGTFGLAGTALTDFTTNIKGIQTTKVEKPNAKVVIGTAPSASTPAGILVLESTTKAMVLPIVDSYDKIINPSPGMMVFTTINNQLAVFNGQKWSFWKP